MQKSLQLFLIILMYLFSSCEKTDSAGNKRFLIEKEKKQLSDVIPNLPPRVMESLLIKTYNKTEFYIRGNIDSLFYFSNSFSTLLCEYIRKNPTTIDEKLNILDDSCHLFIATSDDNNFRIYSWDNWTGGTMRFFENIIQFRSDNDIYCILPDLFSEDDPASYCTTIFTFTNNTSIYYMPVSTSIGGTSLRYTEISAFQIENGNLNDSIKLFKTKSDLANNVGFEYDLFSVLDLPEFPNQLITFDKSTNTIYIPVVDTNMQVTEKLESYKFNGEYFELIEKP